MAEIYINFRDVRHVNYELSGLEERADSIQIRIRQLKNNVPNVLLEKDQIGQRLVAACQDMEKWKEKVNELFEVTKSCIEHYAEAERRNEKNANLLLQWSDSNEI